MNIFAENKEIRDTKIVVAMSGGVDSSVVAAMLHEQGYQVIGITLQLYDHGIALMKKGACCAGQDIYDAKQVAEKLGFPHYVLDYESLFKQEVMDDFADSYLRGETPIPCVKCNQSVKFRDLYKFAKNLGADALATGHYVKKIKGKSGSQLHKAVDASKDQSYFLFATTKEQLDYIHFPLGSYSKEETRQLAKKYGLEIADKPDSQDICFVPDGNYSKVIERLRPGALDKGDIVHINGEKIGEHEGIINYTLGQRKGISVGWKEPLYVIKIEPYANRIIVGPESELGIKSFQVKELNWIGDKKIPEDGMEVFIKTRSTHKGVDARIIPFAENKLKVKMHKSERSISPGQACVIYLGNRVLGGGWITLEK